MARILVLNNFATERAWDDIRRGERPGHLLYGIDRLAAHGHDIEIVPLHPPPFAPRVQAFLRKIRFPFPLGNLDRQGVALRAVREGRCDAVYAAAGNEANLLALLRSFGRFPVPVVVLLHHPFDHGRLAALRRPLWLRMLRGVDALATLTGPVAAALNRLCAEGGVALRAEALPWGPEADFYPVASTAGEGFVCAGRTGRDFITFGRAASVAGVPARIFCVSYNRDPAFRKFAPNVTVQVADARNDLSYRELLEPMLAARAIAVPLHPSGTSLAGLTGIMDALGLGKPVIVTRSPLFDLDVDALGIGLSVAPRDVDGWAKAMEWFQTHPEDSLAMGRRARALVEEGGRNADEFGAGLVRIIEHVLPRSLCSRR